MFELSSDSLKKMGCEEIVLGGLRIDEFTVDGLIKCIKVYISYFY